MPHCRAVTGATIHRRLHMDNALVPFDQIERMAVSMAKSGLFGKTPEQMMSLMLIAQAEGLHPAIAAQEYDIIKGRPTINSRSALARFQSAGGSIKWMKRTDNACEAEFSHPQGGTLKVRWDVARAKAAGLWDKKSGDEGPNMYHKFGAQMLSARVVAEGIRAVYPVCLSRMYLPEEIDELPESEPEPRNVTPQTVTEQIIEQQQDEKDIYVQSVYDEFREIIASGCLNEPRTKKLIDMMEQGETNAAVLQEVLAKVRAIRMKAEAKE